MLNPTTSRWRGELLEHAPLSSPGIAPRPLFVYLPPSYTADHRLPLVVLHDGQNLFEPERSFAGSWRVPEAVDELDAEGMPLVVAGIPNGGERRIWEYTPFHDARHGGGGASHHLRFLLESVRPLLQRSFAVSHRREAQAVGGGSLGALVSLWALFQEPEAFGRVAALSPTTLFGGEKLRAFLERSPFVAAKIHLDCGSEEGLRRPRRKWAIRRITTAYVKRVRRLKRALVAKGYRVGRELAYLEAKGGTHSEAAWARRLPGALRFLFTDESG